MMAATCNALKTVYVLFLFHPLRPWPSRIRLTCNHAGYQRELLFSVGLTEGADSF